MKLRGAIAVGIVALVLWLMHLMGVFSWLGRHWFGVLLSIYLFLGLVIVVAGGFGISNLRQQVQTYRDRVLDAQAKTLTRDLDFYRRVSAEVLLLPSSLLWWSVEAAMGVWIMRNPRHNRGPSAVAELGIRVSMFSRDTLFAVCAALVTVVLVGIAHSTGSAGRRVTTTAIVMMTVVFLRHVRYIVSVEGLPVILRRVRTYPFLSYALILTADGVTLILGDRMVTRPTPPFSAFEPAAAIAAWKDLFDFTQFPTLFQNGDARGLLLLGVGGLFYITLGRSLVSFRDFAKDDSDHLWRANAMVQLGRLEDALKEIRAITKKSAESEGLQAIVLILLNRLERAEERAQTAVALMDEKPSPDLTLQVLAQAAGFHNNPAALAPQIIEIGLRSNVRDSTLQSVIALFYAAVGRKDWNGRSIATLVGSQYPLSRARLHLLDDRQMEAEQLLKGTLPGDEIDEVTRLLMLLQAQISGPSTPDQDRLMIEAWRKSSLPVILDLARSTVSASDLTLLHGQMAIVQVFIDIFADVEIQELNEMIADVESRLSDNPILAKDIAIRKGILARVRTEAQAHMSVAT